MDLTHTSGWALQQPFFPHPHPYACFGLGLDGPDGFSVGSYGKVSLGPEYAA